MKEYSKTISEILECYINGIIYKNEEQKGLFWKKV